MLECSNRSLKHHLFLCDLGQAVFTSLSLGFSKTVITPILQLRRKKVHSSEKASNLPKVTQLLNGRGSILTEHTVFATTSAVPEGISHIQGGAGVI